MENLNDLLIKHGPMTGKEMAECSGMDYFVLWKACYHNPNIVTRTIGSRYLRLDKHVEGLARLSPSILREFCNYTVIGLAEQSEALNQKADKLHREIIEISGKKRRLAEYIMEHVIDSQPEPGLIRKNTCFIIAGDVAFEMAHLEPRPEFSTGTMVNGSDLDIVIVYRDLPESTLNSLDASVYENKYSLLRNPVYNEEIDYVIKDLAKVEKQLAFDSFEAMVASKILDEGAFLCGSFELFSEIKQMVADFGIPGKLSALKEQASIERESARRKLLALSDTVILDKEMRQLFYTTSEREEFF
jgi:hypothetical protein